MHAHAIADSALFGLAENGTIWKTRPKFLLSSTCLAMFLLLLNGMGASDDGACAKEIQKASVPPHRLGCIDNSEWNVM
jgi:hypothetical protein